MACIKIQNYITIISCAVYETFEGMPKFQCCENPPALNSSYGAGHVEEIGGLNCYVAGSADSKCAVILASDVYGYEAPHLRMIADKVAAAAGYYTLVPDFFHGDPFVANENLTLWKSEHTGLQGMYSSQRGIYIIGVNRWIWSA